MYRLCILLILTICASVLAAADLPLGVVTATDGKTKISATFNSDHHLLPDDMVALFGPGVVVKHPMTGVVETEQRKLVGKAHVLQVTGATLEAQVTWIGTGVKLLKGYDVIPLPGEASPDAPPVLYKAIRVLSVEAQQTVTVTLPVVDPEEGPLGIVWSLMGDEASAGRLGQLSTQSSGIPEIQWTAPARACRGRIHAVVTDSIGQQLIVDVPFTVKEIGTNYRQRKLKQYTLFGGSTGAAFNAMDQDDNGVFWAIGAGGRTLYHVPTWGNARLLDVASDVGLRTPQALAAWNKHLYILDAGSRQVLVLNEAGQLQRQLTTLRSPTDMAISSAGTLFVADQGAGGVQVYENNGTFRLTLGRTGTGTDSFTGLKRVCLDQRGTCYALDAGQRMIQRFDKFHKRLRTWTIDGDPAITLIDIAMHPLGLLILMSDGRVLIHTDKGLSGTALTSVAESGLVDRLTLPTSLCVDRTNRIYVTYPREKILARYTEKGQLAGVRGPSLWSYTQTAADAKGWIYGLDARSGFVYAHDDEGWRIYRCGGTERNGGPFVRPSKLAVAWDGSALVVGDAKKYALYHFDLTRTGATQTAVFGQRGKNNGQFSEVTAICMDDAGRSYVADARNRKISVFGTDGSFLYNFGSYSRGRTASELIRPQFLAVDAAGTTCYVYDSKRYEIQKFELNIADGTAKHITNQGGRGKALGQVSRPIFIGCDRLGLLYVADSGRKDLQVLDFRGNNMVGIQAIKLQEEGLNGVDSCALNPDGTPYAGNRGQIMGFRWSK